MFQLQPRCETSPSIHRCLSLDLEVGKEDGRIHAFGAVRGDTGHCVPRRRIGGGA